MHPHFHRLHEYCAIGRDIIMRPVISIPHSVLSIPSRLFLLLFRSETKLRCMHTARRFLSLFLFNSLSSSFHAHLTLLPLSASALLSSAHPSWMRLPLHSPPPSLFLFSDGFSFSPLLQTLEPHLASPYQLFLICYTAIPSPPSVLLPTGLHENTYFTGIHDGRRTSVRTCLLGCL